MGGVNIHEECLSWPTCRFENKKLQYYAVHYATPHGVRIYFDTIPGVPRLRRFTTGLPYVAPRRLTSSLLCSYAEAGNSALQTLRAPARNAQRIWSPRGAIDQ